MTDKKYIPVRNLSGQPVTMVLPDEHVRVVFGPTETQSVEYDILRKVYSRAGGATLFQDFLGIQDAEVAREFGVSEDALEHEYKWTAADVQKLLQSGSLDELKDALEFAPEGITDLIVSLAVEIRLPDVRKRQVIHEFTGKDINSMIQNQIELERQLGNDQKEEKKERRVKATSSTTESTGRRAG